MFGYYSFTILMTVCTCAIMMVTVAGNVMLPKRNRRLFLALFCAISVAALCEWGGVMLNGAGPQVRIPVVCLKVIEFSLAPSLAVLFASVMGPGERGVRISAGVVAVHALLEVALVPCGAVISVDGTGTYHHGPAYAIYMATYLASALSLLLATHKFSRKSQYRNRVVPWLVVAFVLSSIIVQMACVNLRIVWLALGIGSIMLYTFYCSVVQQTDALTQLLNRHSFESSLSTLREKSVVIMFDVDDFKTVNDTYGHVAGDECLRIVARAIFETYGKAGACYRVGGDEFCAILTDPRADVQALSQTLSRRLEEERRTHPGMPSVSTGQASFDPQTDDVATAYGNADAVMYAAKQRRKSAVA